MRFKIGRLTDFKLYKKPKLMRYEYGKGFIVSVGLFRSMNPGGMYDVSKFKEIELEVTLSNLYKLVQTDISGNYNDFFYKSYSDFKYEWEDTVLKSINKVFRYSWTICDENMHHDNWNINTNRYRPPQYQRGLKL